MDYFYDTCLYIVLYFLQFASCGKRKSITMSNEDFDPCECMFNHHLAMQRLLSFVSPEVKSMYYLEHTIIIFLYFTYKIDIKLLKT